MKDYDSARLVYMEALEVIRKHGSNDDLAYALGNIGDLYEEIHDYDQAISYNLQALEIRRGLSNKRGLASPLIGVGHVYYKMNEYKQAEKYLNEGITVAQETGTKHLLQEGYADLSAIYAAKGDFKKAFNFNVLTNQWKDSIYNENTSQQVNTLKTRYETSEKNKQIAILAKEKEVQEKETQRQSTIKKAFIVGFILVIVLAALTIYAFRQRLLLMKTSNEIKEVNLKHQLSELEMKALRAQINPHFLFNCLNSINRMIVKGENENASLYLKKFSKLVRLIVENVETNRVSLDNELSLIEAYIQLEELRFKGKIGYEISIDENIEKENTFLPPMVLQPFVENAIWHGLMYKDADEQGRIKIVVKEDDEALLCTIEDNGIGRARSEQLKEENADKTKSVGLKITEERLKLLNRERLQELVKIIDLKDTFDAATGTRVEISIPLS
jgi:tetratricopeptide (TPR) repeat protein